jgi:hypothetical protein
MGKPFSVRVSYYLNGVTSWAEAESIARPNGDFDTFAMTLNPDWQPADD